MSRRAVLALATVHTATYEALLWPTFAAPVDDAGMCRRYGGIHFPDADLNGRALGASVGQNVWDKAQTYYAGTGG